MLPLLKGSTTMPPDLTMLDGLALGGLLLVWGGYTVGLERFWRRPFAVNQHLRGLRVRWIRAMLGREMRLIDSQLVGHTMSSVTFFASTTALILAALLGLLGNVDHLHAVVSGLRFVIATSPELFEAKLMVLTALFIYAFFQFTWALRQYNYTCALLGAAPPAPLEPEHRDALAETIASVMSHAVTSLNSGLRAYYFALAVLAWFIHPALFLGMVLAVGAVLVWRQLWSGTAGAIVRHVAILDQIDPL